jgi:hypothetical protein
MTETRVDKSIFLGLITHSGSKYLNSFGIHEKFENLTKEMNIEKYSVHDINATDASLEKIVVRDEIISICILMKSLIQTQLYLLLKSKFHNFVLFTYHVLSGIYSTMKLLFKLQLSVFSIKHNQKYRKMIARQHNISEAHITQLSNSLVSNLTHSLILEDDFILNKTYPLSETLSKIVKFIDKSPDVNVISISESFSPKLLGFGKVSTYIPFEGLDFYNLSTPVTNTVSAMFYKSDILNQLIPILKSYRRYKIIPIDHKFNMAFVELGKIKENKVFALSYLSPGLFIQGSIHDD